MSRTMRVLLVFAFLATSVVLIAREDNGSDAEGSGAEKDSRPDVHAVDPGDPEMNAAMDKARSTVESFIRQLPAVRAGGEFFSVKFPISENGETEHVWINEPGFDGEHFTGYLSSEPVNLPSWSSGDRVSVAADGISDWLAIVDGALYGGFTLYVLQDRMSPAEQQALYEGLGMELPAGPAVWP